MQIDINSDDADPDSLFDYGYITMDDDYYLEQQDMTDSELLETMSEDTDEEYDYSARYCHDCGCKLTCDNDAGAFCIKCAPNH